MWIGVLWAGLRAAMWITHVGGKFRHGLLEKSVTLVVQHCDPPYRAIGYSYTYLIYVFQCTAGYRAIPPLLGVSQNYVEGGGVWGGLGGGFAAQACPLRYGAL